MRKVILVFIISILFLLVSADWPTNNFEESISDIFMSFRTGTFHEAIDIPLQNINDMVFSINKAKIDGENIINPKILYIKRDGYNSYIIIGFSDDTAFVYGHILARNDIEEDDSISFGTYLGKFAYTNGVNYPHIHFQSTPDIVNPKDWYNTQNIKKDPLFFIGKNYPMNLHRPIFFWTEIDNVNKTNYLCIFDEETVSDGGVETIIHSKLGEMQKIYGCVKGIVSLF